MTSTSTDESNDWSTWRACAAFSTTLVPDPRARAMASEDGRERYSSCVTSAALCWTADSAAPEKGRDGGVGAGIDDDGVLARLLDNDDRHPARRRNDPDGACVDARLPHGGQQLRPRVVVAYRTHHGRAGTRAGAGDGLVESLAAGVALTPAGQHGLSRSRDRDTRSTTSRFELPRTATSKVTAGNLALPCERPTTGDRRPAIRKGRDMTTSTNEHGHQATDDTDVTWLSINTIRTLAMDAVQAANSGHPGTAMALAPVAYTLWQKYLRYDPELPIWANRDRFVLSVGHASTLLYNLLHLSGVKAVNPQYETLGELSVPLDELRRFRQLDSKCPGHPEYRWTAGVECTTGPLGTGIATSVGMAIAGQWQAATFNRPGFDLFDYDVYALCGDGDLMEGVGAEAASLAGHLRLSNLCWVYDSNRITIEGSTELAFSEDVDTRFTGLGWAVERVSDANDLAALGRAFDAFKANQDRPTLIIVDTVIGYGAPNKQGTAAAHGEPLGEDEVRAAKRSYGWPEDAQFVVPEEVYADFDGGIRARGRRLRREWEELYSRYTAEHPALADTLDRMQRRLLPDGWDADLPQFAADAKGVSGRDASGKVLNAVAQSVPWLIGGSADLAPSNKSRLTFEGAGDFSAGDRAGRNLHFGVREHAAAAVTNGLALSKVRAYQAGFLIFSDFQRGAVRLSALMELPVIHLYTHDSIGVGEDGPTHQPVEHLASLRAMPGMIDMRPADANEVVEAWRTIMPLRHEPVALVLSRQPLPTLDRSRYAPAAGVAHGAYVLAGDPDGIPDVILIATGSEVSMAIAAHEQLVSEGVGSRVVSMPSMELFDRQPQDYRDAVLPPTVTARVAIEQASSFGWDRWVGPAGRVIAMGTFGSSAPLKDLQTKFGFTPEAVTAMARALLEDRDRENRTTP
jgi:transketolase